MIVQGGAAPPFSVIRAEDESGEKVLLWSPSYEESEHIYIEDGGVLSNLVEQGLEIEPNGTLTQEYHVEADRVTPGEYDFSQALSYGRPPRNQTSDPNTFITPPRKPVQINVSFTVD